MAISGLSDTKYIDWDISSHVSNGDGLTVAVMMQSTDWAAADYEVYVSVGDASSPTNQLLRIQKSTTSNKLAAATFTSTIKESGGLAETSPTANEWTLLVGRAQNAYRRLYVSGFGLDVKQTTSLTVTGVDIFRIGASADSTPAAGAVNAKIAWSAIWNHGNTVDEALYISETSCDAMAAGADPRIFKPQDMILFVRGDGSPNLIDGTQPTTTGSPTVDGEDVVVSIGPHWQTAAFVPRYAELSMSAGSTVAESALTGKTATITLHNAKWVA